METYNEFINQVVEDYGWDISGAKVVAFFYKTMLPDCSWQQRWEKFCEVENGR